jgi:hypothetical protein
MVDGFWGGFGWLAMKKTTQQTTPQTSVAIYATQNRAGKI